MRYWLEIHQTTVFLWESTSEPPDPQRGGYMTEVSEAEYNLISLAKRFYLADFKYLRKATKQLEKYIEDIRNP